MKKLLSILLAFSMVVGLLTGITLTAAAEEVDYIDITGIPTPGYGVSLGSENIQASGSVNYDVEAEWQYWTNENGWVKVDSDTFGYGEYLLTILVSPAGDEVFDFDERITIDGTPIEELNYGWYYEAEDIIYIETSVYIEPENGYIHYFAVSGAPEDITAGQDITVPELVVEDGMVTITDVQWLDSEKAPVSGKFEDNELYYLAISVVPSEEGYAFENWIDVDLFAHSYNTEKKSDGSAVIYARYSLRPTVDSFDITVEVPEIGAAPAEPQMENDKAAIANYWWMNYHTGEEVTEFEDGKKYSLEIEVKCDEGYDLAENFTLTVNGEKNIEYGQSDESLYITLFYTFQNIIDRIDVTMPEPAVGQEPDYADIEVSGEDYEITSAEWYSVYEGEALIGAFGKDKYSLELQFTAADGSEFANDCVVYVNGVMTDYVHAYDNYAYTSIEYSFRDVISKVELPAFPEVNIGDEIESVVIDGPEGAHYQANGMWFDYNGGNMDPAEGKFEDGKVYYLMLEAVPERGYEFAEDAVITVGGEKYTGLTLNASEDYLSIIKMFASGVKVIDKIELNVPALENGKPHGEITVPEDANYALELQEWAVSDVDDMNKAEILEADDAAAYGKYYWFAAAVMADEGYVFAEDAQVLINGKPVELDSENSVVIANMGQIIHGLGKLTEPADPSNPNTNDRMPVVPMVLLAVLSMAGVAVTVAAKKRYY